MVVKKTNHKTRRFPEVLIFLFLKIRFSQCYKQISFLKEFAPFGPVADLCPQYSHLCKQKLKNVWKIWIILRKISKWVNNSKMNFHLVASSGSVVPMVKPPFFCSTRYCPLLFLMHIRVGSRSSRKNPWGSWESQEIPPSADCQYFPFSPFKCTCPFSALSTWIIMIVVMPKMITAI